MKRFIFLALTVFSTLQVFAEKKFYIGSYFSIKDGIQYEHLYSSADDNQEVSLLEWEYSPLYCFGLSCDFNSNGFKAFFKMDTAIPASCGYMYDSDFFFLNGIKDTCNYSKSENFCRKNFNTEIGTGYELKFLNSFFLRPSLKLEHSFYDFKAENGRGRYGRAPYSKTGQDVNWKSEYAKEVKLYGCEFKRHLFNTWLGIETFYSMRENFNAGFCLYTNLYSYTYSLDHHLNKPTLDTYLDMAASSSFSKYRYGFFTNILLSQRLSFNASLEFTNGPAEKGKSRYADCSKNFHSIKQKTGANAKQMNFTAGLKIAL